MDLTVEELRVLGCLIEKGATTPDNYPLSSNALRAACNQSTNREPVVEYSEQLVDATMLELRQRGFAETIRGSGSRVPKHRHAAERAFDVDAAQLAVLTLLWLRGPQTLAELTTRTERYASGPGGTEGVRAALDALAARGEKLVVELDRRPGERERRFAHLVGGAVPPVVAPQPTASPRPQTQPAPDLAGRVADLTRRVEDLEAQLAELVENLGG